MLADRRAFVGDGRMALQRAQMRRIARRSIS
jgi:hypothetical protein